MAIEGSSAFQVRIGFAWSRNDLDSGALVLCCFELHSIQGSLLGFVGKLGQQISFRVSFLHKVLRHVLHLFDQEILVGHFSQWLGLSDFSVAGHVL